MSIVEKNKAVSIEYCRSKNTVCLYNEMLHYNFWGNVYNYAISSATYQVRTIFWHNRWSGAVPQVSNRMKRSHLQKETKHTLFWGVWECKRKNSLLIAKLQAKSQKPWKVSLSYSFGVGMGHLDMVRWKYDSVCTFSMLRGTLELSLWKKADKICKDQKRSIFFTKGALIGKSIFQTQRINAVHGRCFSSGVLRDIPSNFTRSLRRRIVL